VPAEAEVPAGCPEPHPQLPAHSYASYAYDRLRAVKRSLVIGKNLQRQLHPEGGVGPTGAARA
jgi:hypothetical protein